MDKRLWGIKPADRIHGPKILSDIILYLLVDLDIPVRVLSHLFFLSNPLFNNFKFFLKKRTKI